MNTVHPAIKIVVFYFTLMLGIGLLLSLGDLAQKKYRFTLRNIGILWTVYTMHWGLRLSVYVLAIPVFLLFFLLQPVLGLAFLIAFFLLVIYGVGLFFEQPRVSNPPDSEEALWALLTVVGCIAIWWLASRVLKSEDAIYDRYADFFIKKVHQPMEQRAARLMEAMDD